MGKKKSPKNEIENQEVNKEIEQPEVNRLKEAIKDFGEQIKAQKKTIKEARSKLDDLSYVYRSVVDEDLDENVKLSILDAHDKKK